MDTAFEESCQKINSLKTKYNDFSSLTQLQTKLDPINEISNKMRKNLENFSLRINRIFNSDDSNKKVIFVTNLDVKRGKKILSDFFKNKR